MKLYSIGGASGSGKTAVIPFLKALSDSQIPFYDFDDIGVPADADTKWRQNAMELWLQKLVCDGRDACLLGQMVLGEIISSPSARLISKINHCLLDVSDCQRIARLKKRSSGEACQQMLNWASWMRMHTHDPQWELHVIQNNAWSGLDFSYLARLKNWSDVASVMVIDTTELKLDDVAQALVQWINDSK